jgi:hypothetical protein
MRPGALPVAVNAVACVVRFKTWRFRRAALRRACPIGDRVAAFASVPPFSVPAGRWALLNSGLPEDSISFCLGVFLESGDNIQLAFKLF